MICGALCAFAITMGCGIGNVVHTWNVKADGVWSETTIESTYDFGETFVVPEYTFTINGATLKAQSVLEYPDGSTTRENLVQLNKDGVYSLRYSVAHQGKVYVKEHTFSVLPSIAVAGVGTSISYGEKQMTFLNRTGTFSHTREGLYVRLAANDKLTFSKLIDVSNATTVESIISLTVLPDTLGTYDFEELTVRLTDSVDTSIYLDINIMAADTGIDYPQAYFLAGGQNQSLSGYAHDLDEVFVGRVGTNQIHSFAGSYFFNEDWAINNKYEDFDQHQTLAVYYDAQENAVYNNQNKSVNEKKLVIDLDNPEHFSTPWLGFPSGKASLSITAGTYTASTANFLITHVKDVDLSDAVFVDTEAPVISVAKEEGDMPEGLLGGTYPIPSATAFDTYSGTVNVKTSVWYNYASPNPVLLEIENGKFQTKKIGNYAIVYEAVDKHGNLATETLWVHVGGKIDQLEVELPIESASAVCGERIILPTATVIGGSGEKQLIISVTGVDGVTLIENNIFTPKKAGEYMVLYTAIDSIGQRVSNGYQLIVSATNKLTCSEKPILPPAFITIPSDIPASIGLKTPEYTLTPIYADDYSSGELRKVKTEMYYTDSVGVHKLEENEPFSPIINTNGEVVTITYKVGNEVVLEKEIPAIFAFEKEENGRIRLKTGNYLIGNGIQLQKETTSDPAIIHATETNGSLTFANAQIAENLKVSLGLIGDKISYQGLRIVLTDTVDSSIQISALLSRKENGKAMLTVNGKTLESSYDFYESLLMELAYASGQFTLGTTTLPVSETENGDLFNGFPSSKVWLKIEFVNATVGRAAYELSVVNGQSLAVSSDRNAPVITVFGDCGGTKPYNEIISLCNAVAGDVLEPNCTFTMTVTSPTGEIVRDVNGKLLENVDPSVVYQIKTSEYGTYLVQFYAVDTFGAKDSSLEYTIQVLDSIAPSVSFKNDFVSTAKVGDVVVIPDVSVSDNVTSANKLIVLKQVTAPNGNTTYFVGNSNAIKCSMVGEYVFRGLVIDEAGNVYKMEHIVEVQGE